MRKKIIPLLVLVPASLAVAASSFSSLEVAAEASTKDLFDYSTKLLKTKEGYVDPSTGKKGLLMYGYEKGMSATFKTPFDGIFTSEIIAIKENGNPSVGNYTLTFTDVETSKSFKLGVYGYSDYSYAYIEVDGEKAGIFYYHTDWSNTDAAICYTAGYNASNIYTKIAGQDLKMQFDPSTMAVKAVTPDGAYHDVWNFSSIYNDGKRLENDLGNFASYTVTLTFESITNYTLSPLLVTNFGGYSFEEPLSDVKSSIRASFKSKAVALHEYTLPTPIASNPIKGVLDDSKMSVKVYDADKNLVAEALKFTPAKAGDYFVVYQYSDDTETISRIFKLPVLESSSVDYSFSFDETYSLDISNTYGLHKEVYLPKSKIKSNLSLASSPEEAVIRIKKDGVALPDYNGVRGGFSYSFDQYGEYEISYESSNNDGVKDSRIVKIEKEVASLVTDNSTSHKKGDSFALKDGKVYQNDKEYVATPTLYYPSGKSAAGDVTLSESGKYSIQYEYEIDGAKKYLSETFYIYDEKASLFESEGASGVSYETYAYDNRYKGVKLSLADNSKVVYKKTIDLNDNRFDETLDDLSQNTKLLELRYAAHGVGSVDAETVYVTLTDADNKDNYVMIRMKYLAYMPRFTRIRAKAVGQGWVGYYYDFDTGDLGQVDNAQVHEDGGFIADFDMSGMANGRSTDETSLQLYFDNDTGRLYSRPWQLYGTADGYKDNRVSWLVRDFSTSDSILSGGDTAWTGFGSGKVELAIHATSISSTADYYVTEIDGEKLDNEYIADEQGPAINVSDDELPKGEVGKLYRYPSFDVSDSSGVASKKTLVYLGNTLVADGGEGFTPTSSGTYRLLMTASDYFGNQSSVEKKIEVLSYSDPLSITLDGEVPSSATLGSYITLPKFLVSGGVGGYTTSISVTSGNKEVEIENNRIYIDRLTDYIVRFIATDYVGNTTKIIRKIQGITALDTPVFEESDLDLPLSLFEGDSYDLTRFVAPYFTSEGVMSEVSPKVTVTDGNGTKILSFGEEYIPVSSDSVKSATIELLFEKDGHEKKISKEIPIVKPQNGKLGFMAAYFAGESCSIEATDDGVEATATAKGMRFDFARSLFGKKFNITWDASKVSDHTLTLRDSIDSSEAIELHFHREGTKLYLSVNGANDIRFYEDGDNIIGLTYKESDKGIYDSRGNLVASVLNNADGSSFNGFSSELLRFEFESEEENSSITVKNIDNQIINNIKADRIGPAVYSTGSLSGRYKAGSMIAIPKVIGYDVLGNVASAEVSVSCDGAVLKKGTPEEVGDSFTPTEIGSYRITYTFKDEKNNRSTYSYYFSVYDDVSPTLTLSSPMPKEAKVGEKVVLPAYVINDQDSSSVVANIYCIDADGEVNNITDSASFVASKRGIYTINYYLIDQNGNTGFYSYEIVVK